MSERLLTVATFANPVEAHLAKNRLESAGIKAFLEGQETVGMAWHLTNAFGGIKLQVPEADAIDATAILQDNAGDELPADDAEEDLSPAIAEDRAESAPTNREQNADRALRGSILGLLLPPVQFYVTWLLAKVLVSKTRLGAVQRKHALVAAVINLPLMLGFVAIVISIWLPPENRFGANRRRIPESVARAAARSFDLGESAFQNGDYEAAFEAYSEAISLDSELAEAYAGRGTVSAHRGQFDLAILDFTRSIELDPNVADVYKFRGNAYRDTGDYQLAIADHDEAIKRSPYDCFGYLERAEDYIAAGDDERAFADFGSAIRLNPSRITLVARALAHFDKGNHAKAVADCTEALKLDPSYFRSYSLRGMAYAAMGRPDDAIADYDRSLRLNPQNYHDLTVRGMAYLDKDELRKALADFDHAIKIDPQRVKAYEERAKAHRKLGDENSADHDEEEAQKRAQSPGSREE
jgi:tetratricopeptide (TPR) repeat protein